MEASQATQCNIQYCEKEEDGDNNNSDATEIMECAEVKAEHTADTEASADITKSMGHVNDSETVKAESCAADVNKVTICEARDGLLKVMHYLQANPPGEDIQMQILLKVLDYINRQANIVNICMDTDDNDECESDSTKHSVSDIHVEITREPLYRSNRRSSSECSNTKLDNANLSRLKAKRICHDKKTKTAKSQLLSESTEEHLSFPDTKQNLCKETSILFNDIDARKGRKRVSRSTSAKSIVSSKKKRKERIKPALPKKVTPHVCSICDKSFNNPGTLTRHLLHHEGKLQDHQCMLCDIKFDDAKGLSNHMDTYKHYVCKQCGRGYNRNALLLKHMEVHSRKQVHSCPYCKQGFKEVEQLSEHIKIHTGVEPYLCTKCNQAFSSSSCLNTHLMYHGDDRPFKCLKCDKAYKHANGLRLHSMMHQGIKEHMCSTCGKCFTTLCDLRKHLPVHTKEKKFICKICDRAFTHNSGLYMHAKSHSNEKPFGCTICDKKFISPTTLTYHMRIHTGEKPYTCETCGKQFTACANMKRHMVVHTGAKPYICAVCGQGFTQSTSCKLHMKNVHGQDDLKPSKVFPTDNAAVAKPQTETIDTTAYVIPQTAVYDTNLGQYDPNVGLYDPNTVGHGLNTYLWR